MISLRTQIDSEVAEILNPVRLFFDATVSGRFAGWTFLSEAGRPLPLLLQGQAEQQLRNLPATANTISIFWLFAAAATF